MTSDEYLESICRENEIIEIIEKKRKTVWSGFSCRCACHEERGRGHVGPALPSTAPDGNGLNASRELASTSKVVVVNSLDK